MTGNSLQKRTATYAEKKIEITVIGAGGKFYATCQYPAAGLLKDARLPYGKPGAKTLPARTPAVGSEKEALKEMLDILEKKLGTRPELDNK
jgi:hypothetical protein